MRRNPFFNSALASMMVIAISSAQASTILPDFLNEAVPMQELPYPRLSAARELATAGKVDQALALIDEVIAETGPSFPALELKGVIQAINGNLDAAIESLSEAAGLEVLSASPILKLGDIYSAKGEPEMAFDMYARAYQLDPEDRKAHQRLGLIYEQRGEYSEAVLHLERGREGLPQSNIALALPLARAQLGLNNAAAAREVLMPAVPESSRDAAAQRVLGVAAYALEDWELAASRLARARELGDRDPQIAVMAAEAQSNSGELARAERILNELVADEGRQPELVRSLASVVFEGGDLDRARELFAELAQGPAPMVQDGLALGQIATIQQDFGAAAKHYNAVIGMAPDRPDGYIRLANLAAGVRDYDGALRIIEAGLERSSRHPDILRRKVLVLARLGRNAEARSVAAEIWEGEGSQAADGVMLASLAKAEGDTDEAGSVFKDVLVGSPENVAAMSGLSLLSAEEGDFETAKSLASRAYALRPDDPQAAHALGWSLSMSDQTRSEGIALLTKATKALPDPVILLRLASAYAAAGDSASARRSASAALQLSSKFPGADVARALAD